MSNQDRLAERKYQNRWIEAHDALRQTIGARLKTRLETTQRLPPGLATLVGQILANDELYLSRSPNPFD